MNRQIIVASHGRFAEGIYSAMEVILGKEQLVNLHYLNCYVDEKQNVTADIENLLHCYDGEIVVFTDLFGGSVNNTFHFMKDKKDFVLVAGVNLALLIEAVLYQGSLEELLSHLEHNIHQYIVFQGNAIQESGDEDFA